MEFVKKYFRYIFYVLLAANGLVINKMHEHDEVLDNGYAPRGMVSLELNFSQVRQDSILKIWDSTAKSYIIQGTGCEKINPTFTGTQVARMRNNWDCLFIVFFSLFLLVFCIRLYPFSGPSPGFRTVLVLHPADLFNGYHGESFYFIGIGSSCCTGLAYLAALTD